MLFDREWIAKTAGILLRAKLVFAERSSAVNGGPERSGVFAEPGAGRQKRRYTYNKAPFAEYKARDSPHLSKTALSVFLNSWTACFVGRSIYSELSVSIRFLNFGLDRDVP